VDRELADLKRAIVATRQALDAIESLILTDAWDALPEVNQRTLARALEDMRRDASVLQLVYDAMLRQMLIL
jgi:hypothetical protein